MKLKNHPFIKKLNEAKWLAVPRLIVQYFYLVARRFIGDGCQQSAMALTYVTLFAVVPVFTLMYSMFSLVPAFQDLGEDVQTLIFTNFVPSAGVEVQSYLEEFSSKARHLSLIGTAMLLVACYVMLQNIEKVFNRIWSTPGRRRGVVGFLMYWAILSLGPILIGATIAINTYLLSIRLFGEDSIVQSALTLVLGYLPWLFTTIAFTLLYMSVPNCKVYFRNALAGGVVTTLAFQVSKQVFSTVIANSAYASVYGAFAVVPIFLIWVYLSWMIILAGAEFVRATETFNADVRGRKISELTANVWVLWKFWEAQQTGEQVRDETMRDSALNLNQWRAVRESLLKHHIITITDDDNYVLLRSLGQTTLSDLMALKENISRSTDIDVIGRSEVLPPWVASYRQRMQKLQAAESDAMDIDLRQLFESNQAAS